MKINVQNIDIKSILLSGACFRVIEEADDSFTNILSDRVVNLKQDGDIIIVNSSNMDNIKEVINNYFDLDKDYNLINEEIIKKNPKLKDMVNSCSTYRILNQDSFEMGISYILSSANKVERISNMVNNIANKYGDKVVFNNKEYHLFPRYEQLKNITIDDLKEFKLGFRDKYIINYLNEYNKLKDIDKLNDSEAIDLLTSIKGIGLKVASCILLFGYHRLDVFPIDTWVKKFMKEDYAKSDKTNDIKKYSQEHFSPYSGLVIQYMFHSKRNIK